MFFVTEDFNILLEVVLKLEKFPTRTYEIRRKKEKIISLMILKLLIELLRNNLTANEQKRFLINGTFFPFAGF